MKPQPPKQQGARTSGAGKTTKSQDGGQAAKPKPAKQQGQFTSPTDDALVAACREIMAQVGDDGRPVHTEPGHGEVRAVYR